MSKYQTIRAIRNEIERINQEIDLRIIKGVSYVRLAQRHRMLRSQLARLHSKNTTWLTRSMSFMSAFMF